MAKRWDYTSAAYDFIGRSSEIDNKTSEAEDGSTFYAVDQKKFYVFYDNQWWEA